MADADVRYYQERARIEQIRADRAITQEARHAHDFMRKFYLNLCKRHEVPCERTHVGASSR